MFSFFVETQLQFEDGETSCVLGREEGGVVCHCGTEEGADLGEGGRREGGREGGREGESQLTTTNLSVYIPGLPTM